MNFTVLGADGFIGSHLVSGLRSGGHGVNAIGRHAWPTADAELGHVIYCVGLTGARSNALPAQALEAHVGLLANILRHNRFRSLLYVSSTRLYLHSNETHEDAPLCCAPADPNDLFNATKIAAEAGCLSFDHPHVRVARLSNVYGKLSGTDNFLTSIIHDAVTKGQIVLASGRQSAKDYIDIRSVVDILPRIALSGRHRLYNVASGFNVEQGVVADRISELTGCSVNVVPGARAVVFKPIDITRLRNEFPVPQDRLLERLPELVSSFTPNSQPKSDLA